MSKVVDLEDFFRLKKYRLIFFLIFTLYFFIFQILTKLILITNIKFPSGVYYVISVSPPVSPQDMPFPLWGPFLSITTPYFDWAMTPLSIGISFLISFLVALNITLYLVYYNILRLKKGHQLLSSLGLLATSLSCSCELFTGLIGSVASNIPFLASITFMETLFEGMVILAIGLLTLSTFVLYNEISEKNVLRGFKRDWKTYTTLGFLLALSLLLPNNIIYSIPKIVLAELSGGIIGTIMNKKLKFGVILSIALNVVIFSLFPILFTKFYILFPLSIFTGLLGELGFKTLKTWAKLGLLHVIGWTLIMPGPLSLILGYPIPFFNFSPSQLIELWISTWIIGTPIAWYAGVYYLQYLREKMTSPEQIITLSIKEGKDYGLKWIGIGALAIIAQTLYFITHVPYYVDYNGYDLPFLTTMTVASTILITVGAVVLGYGILKLVKAFVNLPRPKKWLRFSFLFAVIYSFLAGVVHIGVYGFPYPPIMLGLFGIPMFEPSITIYVPHIIGLYIYPLQILQLISASLMSGALLSYSLYYGIGKRATSAGIVGSFAVCPACTLSTFSSYGLSLVASAITASSIATFISSLYGELLISLSSQLVLLSILIYVGKKIGRQQHLPRSSLQLRLKKL